MNLSKIPASLPKPVAELAINQCAKAIREKGTAYIAKVQLAVKPEGKKATHLLTFSFQSTIDGYSINGVDGREAAEKENLQPSKKNPKMQVVEVADWTIVAAEPTA